jgi:hypothetical protein
VGRGKGKGERGDLFLAFWDCGAVDIKLGRNIFEGVLDTVIMSVGCHERFWIHFFRNAEHAVPPGKASFPIG